MGVRIREDKEWVVLLTLSPALIAAATTAEQLFTLTGLKTTDIIVSVTKPTAQAGISVDGARVSAANQIGILFGNNTAGGLTPTAAEVYKIYVFRPETTFTTSLPE